MPGFKTMKMFLWMVAIVGISASGPIYGQPNKQVCSAAEITLIESTNTPAGVRHIGKTEKIDIVSSSKDAITVIAQGPILGSMDSSSIETELSCLPDGVGLTVTVTRSDNFNGAVLQNVTWFPRISLSLKPLQPSLMLHTLWRMQTTSGRELTFAETPPFPGRRFPVRVTKKIHTSNK